MNKKNVMYVVLATFISSIVFFTGYTTYTTPSELYHVYISGKTIGYIESKEELESYINEKEAQLKEKYNVEKVYAPKDLNIVKEVTYNKKYQTKEEIYNKIKNVSPFTVKGYTFTIKGVEEADESEKYTTETIKINVLDKDIFINALKSAINVFINENDYDKYINNSQLEIKDTGSLIENVYIENEITVKETKISTNDEIYTNSDMLSKYLLFGTLEAQETYTVKPGDTIEQVSYDNKLSVEEFLIANSQFNSVDNILYPGEVVTLGILKPAFKLIEEDHVIELENTSYKTEIVYDNSMLMGVEKVKQEGQNGTNKVTKKIRKSNGEVISAVVISSEEVKPTINRIIVRGKGSINIGSLGTWAWPTATPYVITSQYGWRWGKFHEGLDISGTGYGSPIYSINDGVVVEAKFNGYNGNYIIINHNNGYYSYYGHMSKILISQGDIVHIGQQIGKMGQSGFATGTHLHLAVYKGYPWKGGVSINPYGLYK
ncbi:MAG: peptidoglycan DD-metalloendopeptidase family protein [bacterium]|nr:peptidoglycan DD-metalloendopeptidase family protein [bacterium]